MNTLVTLLSALELLVAKVVFLRLAQALSTAQDAGSTLVLRISGFFQLKCGKGDSSEHQPEDGAS
jgi:hypothetical protein